MLYYVTYCLGATQEGVHPAALPFAGHLPEVWTVLLPGFLQAEPFPDLAPPESEEDDGCAVPRAADPVSECKLCIHDAERNYHHQQQQFSINQKIF